MAEKDSPAPGRTPAADGPALDAAAQQALARSVALRVARSADHAVGRARNLRLNIARLDARAADGRARSDGARLKRAENRAELQALTSMAAVMWGLDLKAIARQEAAAEATARAEARAAKASPAREG